VDHDAGELLGRRLLIALHEEGQAPLKYFRVLTSLYFIDLSLPLAPAPPLGAGTHCDASALPIQEDLMSF
jgi:hypothetical protein